MTSARIVSTSVLLNSLVLTSSSAAGVHTVTSLLQPDNKSSISITKLENNIRLCSYEDNNTLIIILYLVTRIHAAPTERLNPSSILRQRELLTHTYKPYNHVERFILIFQRISY
ncbi:hypothetical protein KCU66_g36, partial [Aureobasidium melanogenum]